LPAQIAEVGPPPGGVFRVGRKDKPVFAAANLELSGKGRFDDPWLTYQPRIERHLCFGVVYCATSLTAAFAETLQGFRVSLTLVADLLDTGLGEGAIFEDVLRDVAHKEGGGIRGSVSKDWTFRRHWGQQRLVPEQRFADICASETLGTLRANPGLAALAIKEGIDDIDLSAVTGANRRFTQACARFVYRSIAENGQPFAGIRYLSRLGGGIEWECWALFDDRARSSFSLTPQSVSPENPAFQEACDILGVDFVGL
jgi:hypothetical protein